MQYQLLQALYDDWGMGQPGQVVEIADPEKAEALEARGLIARKMVPASPENKMLPGAPENKAFASIEVKRKPRRRVLFGTQSS